MIIRKFRWKFFVFYLFKELDQVGCVMSSTSQEVFISISWTFVYATIIVSSLNIWNNLLVNLSELIIKRLMFF